MDTTTTAPALPGIEAYGVIGDTRSAALLGRGSIDWWCPVRFDSLPVFGRLVGGPSAGSFSIAPSERTAPPVARYRQHSAVMETVWDVDGGELQVTDGLVAHGGGGLLPQSLLVRRVEARGARVPVRVCFDPRHGEHPSAPTVASRGGGTVCTWRSLALALLVDGAVEVVPGREVVVDVDPARPLTFATSVAQGEPLVLVSPSRAWDLLQESDRWWRSWVGGIDVPDVAEEAIIRSLITLRILTYAPSGAPVASVTTSLPEWPGGARNWDYRHAWVRDASIGVAASLAVGNHDEAAAFLYWLMHATRLHRPMLPPALRIDGRDASLERELEGWPGYQGARPVRMGNAASRQHQLDGYGWVVDAAWQYHRTGRPLFGETWRMVAGMADVAATRWREPDAGIWEVRSGPRHFVHSKLMAWMALDRALRMAPSHRPRGRRVARWRRERDAIAEDVHRRGFEARRGTYVRAYDIEELDAALLLLPIIGVEPVDSPRVTDTIDAVRRELSAGGPLIYRYPPGTDGLDGPEGAFLPCSFWLVQALAATGRREEAHTLFAELIELASPMGLFAEELHPQTGQMLGNMPMAFTHATLLQAALALQGSHEDR